MIRSQGGSAQKPCQAWVSVNLALAILPFPFHNEHVEPGFLLEVCMRIAHLLLSLIVLAGFSAAQDNNVQTQFPVGPRYLSIVGANFLRPLATPTLNLDTPLPPIPPSPKIGPVVENQPYISNPELANQADLFPIYYGYEMIPVIELVGSGPSEIPENILDDGVTRMANPQSLREMGYGVSLGEHAAFWKESKASAPRVYTNSDVESLRQK